MRAGIGFDTHRLEQGRRLVLGGVEIEESEAGLARHSDADVLTHAVIDALLGAAGLGDIGVHFPDTEARWRDADSISLLRTVRAMLRDALSYNAYGTASIEGNPLSLEEVQSVLARGPTPDAMRTPDEREILDWAAFMEALDTHAIPRTVAHVEALHATLFQGVMDAHGGLGRIKDRPNYIGRKVRAP
jgi:hypothetical protein